MARTTCTDAAAAWAKEICAAIDAVQPGYIDDTDFPIGAHVYALKDVAIGEFLASASTYDDSVAADARPGRETFIRTSVITGDGKPLTFGCGETSNSGYWCRTSYLWQNGAHINYVFRSSLAQVEAKGLRVDAKLREFLAPLRVQAAN